MHNLNAIIFLVIVQIHAEDLAVSQKSQYQDSSIDMLSGKLVDKLTNQRLRVSSLHNVDLDDTTLGKSRSLPVISGSARCSSTDEQSVWALGSGTGADSWPTIANECAHASFNLFVGIESQAYNKCLTEQASISHRCSTCFADAAQYALAHCKLACFSSPWNDSCLKCVAGFDTARCAGFQLPSPVNNSHKGQNAMLKSLENGMVNAFHKIHHIFALMVLVFFVGSGVKSFGWKATSWEGILVFLGRDLRIRNGVATSGKDPLLFY